jgi:hypothetical protein
MEQHRKHNLKKKRSYGGGGFFDALSGNRELIMPRSATSAERRREYYMGEGGGFPRVRAMVSLVSPESLVACPNTKGALESELTNLLASWM